MLCEGCQKRPSTVHVTKIVNGNKTEMNLCEICAQENNAVVFGLEPKNWMLQNFFADLFSQPMLGKHTVGSEQSQQIKCEHCGYTDAQLSKVGKLGCSDCYQTFADQLEPLLRRVHGNSQHKGKIPKRTGGSIELRKRIEELKRELQTSVSAEEYEKAAEIRDELRGLEQKLK